MRLRAATVLVVSCLGAVLLAACEKADEKQPDPSRTTPPVASTTVASVTPSSTTLTPVPKVLDVAAMQESVKKVLIESYQLTSVETISCPANQPVTVGHTFECATKIDGKEQKLIITVKTSQGEYEVGQPK